MKELVLGAATFTLALFAMQSVVSAQTITVSPTATISPTTTPSSTGEVKGAALQSQLLHHQQDSENKMRTFK